MTREISGPLTIVGDLLVDDDLQVIGTIIPGGSGIDFSGHADGGSSFIRYKEGTWTPAITSSNADQNVTYTSRSGKYTLIGDMIFFDFSIVVATISGTGNLRVSLPYACHGGAIGMGIPFFNGVDIPGTPYLVRISPVANQAYMEFDAMNDNAASAKVLISGVVATDLVRGAGFYWKQ